MYSKTRTLKQKGGWTKLEHEEAKEQRRLKALAEMKRKEEEERAVSSK